MQVDRLTLADWALHAAMAHTCAQVAPHGFCPHRLATLVADVAIQHPVTVSSMGIIPAILHAKEDQSTVLPGAEAVLHAHCVEDVGDEALVQVAPVEDGPSSGSCHSGRPDWGAWEHQVAPPPPHAGVPH